MSQDELPRQRGHLSRTLISAATLGIVVAAAAAALVASGDLSNPFGPPDPLGAIAACEAGLKKSLVAPSTYHRISATAYMLPPLTKEEHRAFSLSIGCEEADNPRACRNLHQDASGYMARDSEQRRMLGLSGHLPKTREKANEIVSDAFYALYLKRPADQKRTAAAEIVYDAANGFNALLRTTKFCRFGPIGTSKKYREGQMFDPSVRYTYFYN